MKLNVQKLVFLICVIAVIPVHSDRKKRSTVTCGVSKGPSGFIVRGQKIERGDFPWIVALMRTDKGPASFFCGGTLISSSFVVSGR